MCDYGKTPQGGNLGGQVSQDMAKDTNRLWPAPLPLRERIGKKLQANQEDNITLSKAYDIVSRHPEFEEFIWLINHSGLY